MPRRAVTLPELLLVVVMLGILAGIGVPRLAATANRAALRGARSDVLRTLDAARGTAIRLGHSVDIVAVDNALHVQHDGASLWRTPGPEGAGITFTGLATPIRFGPSGIATGVSNRTLRLHKGSESTTVVISRLGRVR